MTLAGWNGKVPHMDNGPGGSHPTTHFVLASDSKDTELRTPKTPHHSFFLGGASKKWTWMPAVGWLGACKVFNVLVYDYVKGFNT